MPYRAPFVKPPFCRCTLRKPSVGCRGASRYVDGSMVWWFYGCLFYCFLVLGCGVLRFYGFLALWFCGCLVLWFCGSMFSKNTKIAFHGFRKILIPYPRFSRFHWTDRRVFVGTRFSKIAIFEFPNIPILKHVVFFYGR